MRPESNSELDFLEFIDDSKSSTLDYYVFVNLFACWLVGLFSVKDQISIF